jgi:hypothetical protein
MRRKVRAFLVRYARTPWAHYRWLVIGVLGALAIALGYWGFSEVNDESARSVVDRLYRSIQLFPLESGAVPDPPWQLHVARVLAFGVAVYAAVSALTAILQEQFSRLHARWLARDHVIVCGLGRCGRLLARRFHDHGYRVVAIEKQLEVPAIGETRQDGVSVITGDATDPGLLRTAAIQRARHVVAVCGDDGTNISVAAEARRLCEGRRRPLGCYVQLDDSELERLLTLEELARPEADPVRVEFFRPAKAAARVLLDEFPPFDAAGDTRFGPPHLLVVGLGATGRALIIEAARRWRLLDAPSADGRLRITVVERAANQHAEALKLRYPSLEKTVELDVHDLDVIDVEFQRGDFFAASNGRADVTLACVCLGEDTRGLSAAVALRRLLRPEVPVVVRTTSTVGPADLVGSDAGGTGIRTFPLYDRVCRPEVLLSGVTELLAHAIHEDYVRKQRAEGQTPATNPSMVDWGALPDTLKDSNRDQAADIGAKLAAVGCGIVTLTDWSAPPLQFTVDEVELLARMEHDRWCRERTASGWTYGPERDADRKVSPYLVPWENLSEEIREYDRNTVRDLPQFLASAGFSVVRAGSDAAGG